ncbi:MAG: crossover junction endodeoxyribonuclease RuvC [Parcubacteria group bacterium Gr01-1014_48]|nr:MAG: crossover junction endodeoxyribonuclease RuvC [Parcubacteria group bacterium Greene0416_14]TSC74318.1 MAG: crossover junction endodeoxyribonuclease RuvC [Parcubacteria group bacterium Gr01-1014_48]TSD01018.1 MAG: crossover junction endodeoxyribonuclease RuvC [Parcubacteria group bacterium Greene1014_15]TSD07677.1 MAG: crossover junction endodeoxyribonuclease RuvC [Parcubacteria group bacterium Greene0714_4]
MKIVSIDPGYERIGIAVLESGISKEIVLYSDCFQTSGKDSFGKRLLQIGIEVERIVALHSPNAIALEKLFFNTNQKTAMHVAEVRGALLYIAQRAGVGVYEYTPLQIKMAILGYGRGEKQQVIDMVKRLVVISKNIRYDDEYDAIAIGLTCLAYEKNSLLKQQHSKNMA